MKEFSAQTGGRYTYVDDIVNLQELALAFASIFDGCDNFIVNGCEISGTSITAGYVYINGKLRYFPGVSGITSWPQFIYENNQTESVAYASGSDKVGRNIFGCAIAKTVPTIQDTLTGELPAFIKLDSAGGIRIKDALFGKYSLLLQAANSSQTVNGSVNFSNDVNINGILTLKDRLAISKGSSIGQMYFEGTNLIVQSRIGNGNIYKLVFSNDNGFQFHVGDKLILTINEEGVVSAVPISSKEGTLGNITLKSNYLFNSEVSSDSGDLCINTIGYKGEKSYFRNTYIGNGKGSVILSILGNNNSVNVSGTLSIASSDNHGLIMKSSMPKSNKALRKTVVWQDSNAEIIGYIGYNSTENNVLELKNNLANIEILGLQAVNIGPAIMEAGELLSKKYVSTATFDSKLKAKADEENVYTKKDIDDNYAKKSNGLIQFITEENTSEKLRKDIGAISTDDLKGNYPEIDKLLSDMATNDTRKAQICKNIGAAQAGSFQPVLKDTGWIKVLDGLFVRQIGNIVSIQGVIRTVHSGIAFTLPNSIDAPKYDVAFSSTTTSYNGQWRCVISGGQKVCTVGYCNNHGTTIPFSMTYMV